MQRVDKWLGDRAQTIYSHYIVISLYNVQSLSEIEKRNVSGGSKSVIELSEFCNVTDIQCGGILFVLSVRLPMR